MKKLFPLICAILTFCSCSMYIPGSTTIGYIDFEQYSSQGVLISSSPYSGEIGDHIPLGEMTVIIKPEVSNGNKKTSVPVGRQADDLYSTSNITVSSPHVQKKQLSVHDAITEMVSEVSAKGGNAIFQFSYNILQEDVTGFHGKGVKRDVIIIKGFAVKLK